MVEPYINFDGKAKQAIDFYEWAFEGTDKKILLAGDMPGLSNTQMPEQMKSRVAYAQLNICGTTVNFSDMQRDIQGGGMISLMVHFKAPEKATMIFNRLLQGGVALMELEPTPYAKLFGWVQDQFGIGWQLICE